MFALIPYKAEKRCEKNHIINIERIGMYTYV